MFLIPKYKIFIFILICGFLIYILCISGLSLIGGDSSNIRSVKERYIFYTILIFISILLTILFLLTSGSSINKKLERLVSSIGDGTLELKKPKFSFLKSNLITEKLKKKTEEINMINQLRVQKIKYFDNITDFLLKNIDMDLIILNKNGTIEKASDQFLERYEINKTEFINKHFRHYFEGEDIENLLNNKSVTFKKNIYNFNFNNQIKKIDIDAYKIMSDLPEGLILILEKPSLIQKTVVKSDKIKKETLTFKNFFKNIFKL